MLPVSGPLRLPVFGGVDRIGDVGARCDQTVLGHGYARGYRPRLVLLVGQVELLYDCLDEVLDIVGLVYGKGLRVSQQLGVLAQNAGEDRVERTHAYITRAAADDLLDTLTHLGRSLVGKCKSQNRMRVDTLFEHVGYARSEHARLARPRAGYDERGSAEVGNGLPLSVVESCK